MLKNANKAHFNNCFVGLPRAAGPGGHLLNETFHGQPLGHLANYLEKIKSMNCDILEFRSWLIMKNKYLLDKLLV